MLIQAKFTFTWLFTLLYLLWMISPVIGTVEVGLHWFQGLQLLSSVWFPGGCCGGSLSILVLAVRSVFCSATCQVFFWSFLGWCLYIHYLYTLFIYIIYIHRENLTKCTQYFPLFIFYIVLLDILIQLFNFPSILFHLQFDYFRITQSEEIRCNILLRASYLRLIFVLSY